MLVVFVFKQIIVEIIRSLSDESKVHRLRRSEGNDETANPTAVRRFVPPLPSSKTSAVKRWAHNQVQAIPEGMDPVVLSKWTTTVRTLFSQGDKDEYGKDLT